MARKFPQKKFFLVCLLMMLIASCKSLPLQKYTGPQLCDPRFPYLQDNLEVAVDNVNADVAQVGHAVGKMARKPQVALESIINGYKGVSDKNPYDRPKPYYYEEYSRDVLGSMGERLMEPIADTKMQYPKPLRAAYMVEGEDLQLTKEAILYKQFLDEVSSLLEEAEALMYENRFDEAFAKVNEAFGLDPTNEAAREMYTQVVRAEERAKYEAERQQAEQMRAEKMQEENMQTSQQEDMKLARVVEEYIARIESSLEFNDLEEAQRLALLLGKIAPDSQRARDIIDQVEFVVFQRSLDPRILNNDFLMEDMILEYFRRYQEYIETGLEDLARRELRKITFLESLKNQ